MYTEGSFVHADIRFYHARRGSLEKSYLSVETVEECEFDRWFSGERWQVMILCRELVKVLGVDAREMPAVRCGVGCEAL